LRAAGLNESLPGKQPRNLLGYYEKSDGCSKIWVI